MNGETHHIYRLAVAARKALKTGSALSFAPLRYENRTEFQFLPEKKLGLFGAKAYKAENAAQWYERCVKNGLRDIKLLVPAETGAEDAALLGFSNTTETSLACFYAEKATYFVPRWEFDSEQEGWDVLYKERKWKKAPPGMPRFENNSESFKEVLLKIKELALKIDDDSEFFADIFQNAFDILEGSSGHIAYSVASFNLPVDVMPEENIRLFEATIKADVFATSGSWTDSPPYQASLKGLKDEYYSLTDELLKQIRLATLYAINEW